MQQFLLFLYRWFMCNRITSCNAKRRVLAAVPSSVAPILEQALAARVNLVCCDSLSAAKELLENDDFDLVLGEIQFDAGQVFQLVQAVKGNVKTQHLPFVAMRVIGGVLPDSAYSGVRKAVQWLGADLYIDLADYWPVSDGDGFEAQLLANLCRITQKCKPTSCVLQPVTLRADKGFAVNVSP